MPFMAFIAGAGAVAFLLFTAFMDFIAGAGPRETDFIAFMALGMVMNVNGSGLRNV